MTADVIKLFPKKHSEITVTVDALTYWKLRNDVISEEFVLHNACEKQKILDTVLDMNSELYKLVLELKEKLGE